MKRLKKPLKVIGWALLVLIAVLNIVISLRGDWYIYSALAKGTPGIYDLEDFYADKVSRAGEVNPLTTHPSIDAHALSQDYMGMMEDYETTSFLVMRGDTIMYEHYWEDHKDTTHSNSFSVAKSIVAILIGIAMDEGHLSLSDSVSKYIPEFADSDRAGITLDHLLTMSSGLSWMESQSNPFSDNAQAYYGSDIREHMLSRTVEEAPGVHWIYKSGDTQLAAMVLEAATGKRLSQYASEKLWGPLGVESDAFWSLDNENGTAKAFCCFYSTTRDFARIGSLVNHLGMVDGKRIISERSLRAILSRADLTTPEGEDVKWYARSWWIMHHSQDHITYYARGILGQYIICIPGLDVVIVRTGHERREKDRHHPIDVNQYIGAAKEILAQVKNQ